MEPQFDEKSEGDPQLCYSGRAWLKRIFAEYTRDRSPEDFLPDEWDDSPAHFAEEALRLLDRGDTDEGLCWAMQAAALASGLDFIRPEQAELLKRFRQNAGKARWQRSREKEKRDAAARYDALLKANPNMKKSAALKKAVEGTSIKPRTLRDYLSRRGNV
jgi:hypothetical protein